MYPVASFKKLAKLVALTPVVLPFFRLDVIVLAAIIPVLSMATIEFIRAPKLDDNFNCFCTN